MLRYVCLILLSIGGFANAHQFTPTYPIFTPSFVEGIFSVQMELFNKRKEVEYYQIKVFDEEWNGIPFAMESKLLRVKYLENKKFNVYARKEDLSKIRYICSESMIVKGEVQYTVITSRICSKIK